MPDDAPATAPYGSWNSPITASLVARAGVSLIRAWALPGGATAWLEGRPTEGGRIVLVRRAADGSVEELTPADSNVRTRVHEYGGGACAILGDPLDGGTAFYANFADQRLYRLDPGREARAITPQPERPAADRVADAVLTPDGRTLICVHEHQPPPTEDGSHVEETNQLVALPSDGSATPRVIASGADFYATPRLSPDGRWLAWLSWTHPRMPWDGTELWLAEVIEDSDGLTLGEPRLIAGGPAESIFQPGWLPDGRLVFVSDRTNWWNLYLLDAPAENATAGDARAIAPMEAECGLPLWTFDQATYDVLPDGRILCVVRSRGSASLALIDPASRGVEAIETPYTSIGASSVHGTTTEDARAVFVAASPTRAPEVAELHLATGQIEVLHRSTDLDLDPGYLSEPEAIEFPTTDGATAHALYYAPRNLDFTGREGERPPLLVMSHGGPTSATEAALSLRTQYWTSRGIAVVDVNYRGSTGYGRAYRQALNHRWGVVDVDDCVEAARYLAARGDVDGQRMAIRGGSAGGYTTLAALTFRDVFACGASYYGIGDLETLVQDTHKFESRYPDSLVGPYPEARDVYLERSPAHHTDELSCPIIMFQGLEDRIVPPSQAEQMAASLRSKGIPYAYVPFEGEQHGFRRAEHIERAHEAELWFYGQILGFTPSDEIEGVEIVGAG